MYESFESSVKCLYIHIIYNKNGRVIYEMIDKCLSCGVLVNIEDLNFINSIF